MSENTEIMIGMPNKMTKWLSDRNQTGMTEIMTGTIEIKTGITYNDWNAWNNAGKN